MSAAPHELGTADAYPADPAAAAPRGESMAEGNSVIPEVVSSRQIYEGRIVSLRVDEIALPDGTAAVREVVQHPGAVVVAAVDDAGYVYLVRQYRHPIGCYVLELPAGKLEPCEEPLLAARRELREEVGLVATDWTPLGVFYSSPGFVNERLYAFLAQGLSRVSTDPDDDEDIEIVLYSLPDLYRHLSEIMDAKTLAVLMLLREQLGEDERLRG